MGTRPVRMTSVSVPLDGTDPHVGGIPLADLVRDFHKQMVNFARTMVDSPAGAEEAVQEAWLQILQSAHSFEGRSSVATWLFAVVKTPRRGTVAMNHGSASTSCWLRKPPIR